MIVVVAVVVVVAVDVVVVVAVVGASVSYKCYVQSTIKFKSEM